jgi:hypothetical protein
MSSIPPKDRVSLCRYSFSDHRQCRTPRSPHHPHFCYFHARQESQAHAASELAADFAYFLSGSYVSANDLNAALARLFPAIIRGEIKPRMAKTLVYLAQVLSQTIHQAQQEYVNAFGGDFWRKTIRTSIEQNSKRDDPPSQPDVAVQSTATTPPNNCHPERSEGSLRPTRATQHSSPPKPQPQSTAATPGNNCHPERSEGSLRSARATQHSSPQKPQPPSTPPTTRTPSSSTPLNATLPKNAGVHPEGARTAPAGTL